MKLLSVRNRLWSVINIGNTDILAWRNQSRIVFMNRPKRLEMTNLQFYGSTFCLVLLFCRWRENWLISTVKIWQLVWKIMTTLIIYIFIFILYRSSSNMFLQTCFGTLLVLLTTVKAAPKPTPTGQVSPTSPPPGNWAKLMKLFFISLITMVLCHSNCYVSKIVGESMAFNSQWEE